MHETLLLAFAIDARLGLSRATAVDQVRFDRVAVHLRRH